MKKQQSIINYKKGTEITDKKELIDVIQKSSVINIKQQAIYNDQSQSMTVEIHFNPKKNLK